MDWGRVTQEKKGRLCMGSGKREGRKQDERIWGMGSLYSTVPTPLRQKRNLSSLLNLEWKMRVRFSESHHVTSIISTQFLQATTEDILVFLNFKSQDSPMNY